ncbi:hypothetical protein KHQ81_15865 (plasmid) [Mycoplasmatota bacterium]|nr:hypothetical protein KHQ81_15865 [Mycoplasmatota bacterium]
MDIEVKPYKNNRYVIVNKETGEIIDDCQGYGYKTKQKAYVSYNYKYNGGRDRHNEIRYFWRKHKKIKKFVIDWLRTFFKEIGHGELTLKDLQSVIKEEFAVEIPLSYLKKI